MKPLHSPRRTAVYLGTLAAALHAALLPVPAPACVPAAPGLAPSHLDAAHSQAVQEFRAGRYASAYGRFARLADRGYAPAAVTALAMAGGGEALFGTAWDASPDQLSAWRAQLARQAQADSGVRPWCAGGEAGKEVRP